MTQTALTGREGVHQRDFVAACRREILVGLWGHRGLKHNTWSGKRSLRKEQHEKTRRLNPKHRLSLEQQSNRIKIKLTHSSQQDAPGLGIDPEPRSISAVPPVTFVEIRTRELRRPRPERRGRRQFDFCVTVRGFAVCRTMAAPRSPDRRLTFARWILRRLESRRFSEFLLVPPDLERKRPVRCF